MSETTKGWARRSAVLEWRQTGCGGLRIWHVQIPFLSVVWFSLKTNQPPDRGRPPIGILASLARDYAPIEVTYDGRVVLTAKRSAEIAENGAQGLVPCEDCDGRGEEECPECDGTGTIACETCHGEGLVGEVQEDEDAAA